MLPDDKPDNALYLGTALHTGLETDVENAIRTYYDNYPIIGDEHINEAIKLEIMIKKAKRMIPKGQHEVLIDDPDFKGFIDLLVPVETNGVLKTFDLYDFKYSNNKQNYLDSDQLHLYKFFFEKNNPLCTIRNMYFLMVPKSKCKQSKGEDPLAYRRRLIADIETLEPELVSIQYDPSKVIRFLLQTKKLLEVDSYIKSKGFLCRYCEYQPLCEKGETYMILPENKRRVIEGSTKKVVWVYGSPFSGKTTFANKFPDPLMLNTDGNIKFVDAPYISIKDEIKKSGRMTERKMAWEVFKEVIAELELKQNSFKTIVVDLLEDTYEHCRRYVCNEKGWDHESDDSFRAWDMVRKEFLDTLKRLMAMDYDNVVLISHLDSSKDLTKKGGDKVTSIKPNINDKIANKVSGMVDIVGRAIADGDQFTLSFKRNEVIFGGGRLKFKGAEIPLDYDAFCKLYDEANEIITPQKDRVVENTVTPSYTEDVASEETITEETVPFEENASNDQDNGTTRRRRRRAE